MTNPLDNEFWKKVIADQVVRVAVTRDNPQLFFQIYFPRHIKYEMAPVHKEILGIIQDSRAKIVVIEAARGLGKTTLVSILYPIYAIVGSQQKKFVVLLAQTQDQAKQYLANIKRKLEEDDGLLPKDMGPFYQPDDEWKATSIVIPKYDARITVASIDKPVRGMQHGEHRPDLIICDDLEDLDTVRTRENRDKIYDWLMGDVLPLGDKDTRLMVIGTRLHEDSIMARLRRAIKEGRMKGICRSYPLVDDNGESVWPGKFPDKEAIGELRQTVPSESAWQREYMLRIVPDGEKVIHEEWIKYYDELPALNSYPKHRFAAIAVDPAFSEKESSDYTAIVAAHIFGYGKEMKIYILPNPINERISSHDIIARVKLMSASLGAGVWPKIYVEDVGAQKLLIDMMKSDGLYAEGVNPHGQDKRARLSLVASPMQAGQILFSRKGCEVILSQLLGFGTERHDDLADAFTMLIIKILEDNSRGGYNFPKSCLPPEPPNLRDPAVLKAGEKEADQEQQLLGEARRSGDNLAWQKYFAFVQKRNRAYWEKEERDNFNGMMGK